MQDGYSIPTANDILSYQGNPGLATGAGTNLQPIKQNPLEGVDSTLDKIQQTNHTKAIIDYQQKIKDRDNLAQMLAETGGSVFNMKNANGQNISFSPLPADQKILTDKAHEIRKMILDHPDNYMYNEDYLDKKAKYNQLVNHAGLRTTAYSGYNADAQKINDPDEKANILSMRDSELAHSLEEGHLPEPYIHKPTIVNPIDAKKYLEDPKKMQEYKTYTETRTDANGNEVNYQVRKIGIPKKEIFAPLYDLSTATTEYAKNATLGFWALPQSQDPAYISAMNADIDRKAADMGEKPVYAATINANGQIIHNPNPREVATALNIEHYGGTQEEAKPTDAIGKQEKQELDMVKTRHDMKIADEKVAIAEMQARNKTTGKPPTAEELKEAQNKVYATSIVRDVRDVFNTATSKPLAKPNYPEVWKKNGVNPDEYYIYPDIEKGVANKFIGIPAPETSTTVAGKGGVKTTEKSKGGSVGYDKAVPIEDKKTREKKIAYWKDGKIIVIVPEKQASINNIKHESNYDPKIYENKTVWVDDAYGKSDGTTNGASQQTPHRTAHSTQQATIPKIDSRIMEGNKKIAISDGKRYEVVGKNKKGEYVGMLID